MRRVVAMLEQPVDQNFAAIWRGVVVEIMHLTDGRSAAGQIEINSSHEFGVRRSFDRMNAVLLPVRRQFAVDPARKLAVGQWLIERFPIRFIDRLMRRLLLWSLLSRFFVHLFYNRGRSHRSGNFPLRHGRNYY